MATFVNPSTSSVYVQANTVGDLKVGYRKIESGVFRVRIQGTSDSLNEIRAYLPSQWGTVKEGDHLSVVINDQFLADAVADAIRASLKQGESN